MRRVADRRDHFLPAAYIGGFSTNTTEKSRDRPVWVNDRTSGISRQPAREVAYVTGLYDLPDPNPDWLGDTIDLWKYENKLSTALRQLADVRVFDARLWIHNLVPFVAGLFSRGPDANGGVNGEGRIIQFQEHLAPVMVADWTVLQFPEPVLPTSDRALAPARTSAGHGYVVPISPTSALLLTRSTGRQLAFFKKNRWFVRVAHAQASPADQRAVINGLASFALSGIYGPTRESVADLASASIGSANRVWPTLIVNERECDLVCHVYDYFRVASALAVVPSQAQAAANRIDFAAFARDWELPIAFVGVCAERTRGHVVVDNETICASLDLGLGMKRLRQLTGDPMRGSYAIFPVRYFSDAGIHLGDDCVKNRDGRADRTFIRDGRLSTVRRVALPPRGRDSPGLPAFAPHRKARSRRRR